MRDTVLVTGGTGKTGRHVVRALRGKAPVRVASREGDEGVAFDWFDPGTYAAALSGVRAVYLVAPSGTFAVLDAMRPFLARALDGGVERFVLLSASSLEAGGPMMGEVHAWLHDHAPEWFVLRPAWFMQNFSEPPRLDGILGDGLIDSATGDGRVAFIDTHDIAAVAAQLLAAARIENRDAILTGPEAIGYDAVAQMISEASGRTVRHNRLGVDGLVRRFEEQGLPADYARLLAGMDDAVSRGSEDRVTDEVRRISGREPTGFADFARREAAAWQR